MISVCLNISSMYLYLYVLPPVSCGICTKYHESQMKMHEKNFWFSIWFRCLKKSLYVTKLIQTSWERNRFQEEEAIENGWDAASLVFIHIDGLTLDFFCLQAIASSCNPLSLMRASPNGSRTIRASMLAIRRRRGKWQLVAERTRLDLFFTHQVQSTTILNQLKAAHINHYNFCVRLSFFSLLFAFYAETFVCIVVVVVVCLFHNEFFAPTNEYCNLWTLELLYHNIT